MKSKFEGFTPERVQQYITQLEFDLLEPQLPYHKRRITDQIKNLKATMLLKIRDIEAKKDSNERR